MRMYTTFERKLYIPLDILTLDKLENWSSAISLEYMSYIKSVTVTAVCSQFRQNFSSISFFSKIIYQDELIKVYTIRKTLHTVKGT